MIDDELYNSLIMLYEWRYISLDVFYNCITGCGQRTINCDGLSRFIFYLNLEADFRSEIKNIGDSYQIKRKYENRFYILPY